MLILADNDLLIAKVVFRHFIITWRTSST